MVKVFESKNPNILHNQELFREVYQYYSTQDSVRQVTLAYLISQMKKNKNLVLKEIKLIISTEQDKESAIHYLSTLGLFTEFLVVQKSDLQSIILEILIDSSPFYQVPIEQLFSLFSQHMNQKIDSYDTLISEWETLIYKLPSSYFVYFFISFNLEKKTSPGEEQFLAKILESIPKQDHLVLPFHLLYFEEPFLRMIIFPCTLR